MTALALFIVLAAAVGTGPDASTPPAPPPIDYDVAAAIEGCRRLPIERQRACVEPHLDALPEHAAAMLRYQTDPALDAAAEAWQREIDAALRARATALAEAGGARNLLAAVLLLPLPEPQQAGQPPQPGPEARGWFAAARAATPAEPLVAWLEASACEWLGIDCDRAAAIERLLALEPRNAAVHLLALADATRRGHAPAITGHLHDAATAERFEPFMPGMLSLMLQAQAGIPWPEPDPDFDEALAGLWGMSSPATGEEAATFLAFGRVLAISLPALSPIAEACPVGGLDTVPGRRADCMSLYALLAADRSSLYRQFALTQLSMHTAGDPGGDHWREQLRDDYWLVTRATALMPGLPGSGITGSEYAKLVVAEGEAGAMQALLRRNGVPVEPPADWLPAPPRQRALVTTGVPEHR